MYELRVHVQSNIQQDKIRMYLTICTATILLFFQILIE